MTGRADLMDASQVGGLGGTYGGNPIAAAAALAVLDKIEREGLLAGAARVGEIVMSRFRRFGEAYDVVGDVRGRGAMCAIELVTDRATKEPLGVDFTNGITRRCLENGVIVLSAGTYGNVLRLLPPINIDEGLLEDGLNVLDEAFGTVAV